MWITQGDTKPETNCNPNVSSSNYRPKEALGITFSQAPNSVAPQASRWARERASEAESTKDDARDRTTIEFQTCWCVLAVPCTKKLSSNELKVYVTRRCNLHALKTFRQQINTIAKLSKGQSKLWRNLTFLISFPLAAADMTFMMFYHI